MPNIVKEHRLIHYSDCYGLGNWWKAVKKVDFKVTSDIL